MNTNVMTVLVPLAVLAGCGGGVMSPSKLAESESSVRGAEELGASELPTAGLYLKLAQEHLTNAKTSNENGDGKEADRSLSLAQVDADLAIALAHEDSAIKEAKAVSTEIAEERAKSQ